MESRLKSSIALGLFSVFFLLTIAFLPQFALIVFVSLILSLLLTPFVDHLNEKTIRPMATVAVLGSFVVGLLVTFFIISATVVPMGQDFINRLPEMAKSFISLPWVKALPFFGDEINTMWEQLTRFSVSVMSSSLSFIISVFTRSIDIVLTLFVTYYFLAEGEEIKAWLVSLFPFDEADRIHKLINSLLRALRIYIISQLSICVFMGVLVYSYFTCRDLPYGPVFAIVSGVSEFIPVIGPTIASLFATAVMITLSPVIGFQTLIYFIFITQLNHNIIYPAFVGHSLRLHPLAIILSLAFAGELIGPLGMFLAVPTTVAVRLIIEDIHRASQKKATDDV